MIKLISIVALFHFLGYTCSRKETLNHAATTLHVDAKQDTIPLQKALVDFDNDIKPILTGRCMPCHFPGGSMYGKLPFDNPKTIREHPTGIFKRIKDPAEVEKLKAFLAQYLD